jgi:glucose 1-dehydrogenase
MKLETHVALVTGAAGGIGLAIARRFAGEGAAVALADQDEKKLKMLAKEIAKTRGVLCAPQRLSYCSLS